MIIREEITKIEGLAVALRNEIEVWFEQHFSSLTSHPDLAQAKADLHEVLGTAVPAGQ